MLPAGGGRPPSSPSDSLLTPGQFLWSPSMLWWILVRRFRQKMLCVRDVPRITGSITHRSLSTCVLSSVPSSRDLRVSCGLWWLCLVLKLWLDVLTAQPCTKVQLEGFWCSFQGDILIIRSRRPAQPSPSVSPPTHQRDARLCVSASSPPINRAKSKL